MTPLRAGLLIAHIAVGAVLILGFADHVAERRTEVDSLRQQADRERAATEQIVHQVNVSEAVRDGLREDDPYVVELVARDTHGWRAPDEVSPPPLPE